VHASALNAESARRSAHQRMRRAGDGSSADTACHSAQLRTWKTPRSSCSRSSLSSRPRRGPRAPPVKEESHEW